MYDRERKCEFSICFVGKLTFFITPYLFQSTPCMFSASRVAPTWAVPDLLVICFLLSRLLYTGKIWEKLLILVSTFITVACF